MLERKCKTNANNKTTTNLSIEKTLSTRGMQFAIYSYGLLGCVFVGSTCVAAGDDPWVTPRTLAPLP